MFIGLIFTADKEALQRVYFVDLTLYYFLLLPASSPATLYYHVSSKKLSAKTFRGVKGLDISFPARAASPERGRQLFVLHCQRCHGVNGEGQLKADGVTYVYPPLWGAASYQRGSSMHRVIKLAQWLKANMLYDKATPGKPFLSDGAALDLAAFVNDDRIHKRPYVNDVAYPHPKEKAIDYDKGPFADSFSMSEHKFGPYQPIIDFWKKKGMKAVY
ncbi:MAG: c-type cytochrome [Flavisolibacter sp.]|nr:c-type cytochrome [Flavisolibacter sp.]